MTVLGLVLSMELIEDALERCLRHRAVWKCDPELVALPDVAQIAAARESDILGINAVRLELPGQLLRHRHEIRIHPFEVDLAAHLELGTNDVVFEIRGQ